MQGNMGNFLKQAQAIKENVEKAQAEVAQDRSRRRGGRRHGEGHDERAP